MWGAPTSIGARSLLSVVSSGTVNYSSANIGDSIFLFCNDTVAGHTQTLSDSGFIKAAERTTNAGSAIWWKIADGTEGATITITRSASSGQLASRCVTFPGGPTSAVSGNVIATGGAGGGANTNLPYGACGVATAGGGAKCLILATGLKTGNVSGFAVASWADAEIWEDSNTNISTVGDYAIQSVAADIASGSWTVSTDVSTTRNSVIVAIAPGPATVIVPTRSLLGVGV